MKPNIVFVLTDDQGYPPIGAHGHPYIRTPELDAFHGESVRFEQFHCGTTCAPTRAGLMTGHYCNSTGVWHTVGGRSLLRRDEWTLADALRGAGYRTGIFGKWHLGDTYPYRPQDRGFETAVCHGGGGVGQQPDAWGNDYFDDTYEANGEATRYEGYCTDVFFREAISFIETNAEQPFFCFISTNAPHGPFNVEPSYRDLYTDQGTSEGYARFLGMITNIDENFGRLRETLRELDLEEKTILIFMSDNGQTGGQNQEGMYNAGMRGLKGSPYDGGHRIPFLIRWPGGGFSTARSIEELTSYVDFMPTMLELCGVEVPEGRTFHGESLAPLMRGEADEHWKTRAVVTDTQRLPHPIKWRMSCVMQDTWRLVNRSELYDLSADPGQTRDIAADHPERVERMRAAYEDWWALCSARQEEAIPLVIGAEDEPETVLYTFDMRDTRPTAVAWNQGHVRHGHASFGWWEIEAERDGLYEFELRRWPKDAGHAIRSGIDGADVEYRADGIAPGSEGEYSGSKALPFDMACLQVSGLDELYQEIADGDIGARFRVSLQRGPHTMRARFASNEGLHMAAYYVYVRRLGEAAASA
jgi:arylsulfatase A-like enzyme